MNMPNLSLLPNARKEFLAYLKFTKGHRDTTCYNYGSDLNSLGGDGWKKPNWIGDR